MHHIQPAPASPFLLHPLTYVWEQLAKKSRFEAANIVCHSSKSTSIRKQNLHYEYIEDFWEKHDFKHPEEIRIGGLERFKIADER